MKHYYTTAITQLLLQGSEVDSVLKNLRTTLAKKGHQNLYAHILHSVVRLLERSANLGVPQVVVASLKDEHALRESIAAALVRLQAPKSDIGYSTDTTLIGGYIANYNGKSIDASHKHALVGLYRSITK